MSAPWDRRSPAEQQRVQGLSLQKWLPSAVDFSNHWHKVAGDLGLESEQLNAPDALQQFPTSRERELVGASGTGAAALVMRPTQEQVKAVATTGTLLGMAASIRRGGREALRRAVLEEYKPVHVHQRDRDAVAVAYSRRDLDRLHLAGQRAATVLGLDEDDYLVSAVPGGPDLAFWGTYHLGLGSSMLTLHPRGHGEGLDAVVDAFGLAPTTAVAVLPQEALALADLLAEADVTVSRITTVVLVGPVPTAEARDEVADAWRRAGCSSDVRVLALWAPPEARALWAEQRDAPGSLVTYPDLDLVEVVDPLTGLPTDGPGDLVLSTVGWTGTALLRFQTGCWVEGLDASIDPATGCTATRIVGPAWVDAWQPTLAGPDGPVRVDLRGIAATVGPLESVTNWLAELRSPTSRIKHDRLVLEVGGELEERELRRLADRLPAALGMAPSNIKVSSPEQVAARIEEAGSVFVDLR